MSSGPRIVEPLPEAVEIVDPLWITMADGCRLAARLWLPTSARATPVPAILEYIPYRRRDATIIGDTPRHGYFAGHGYACLRVDMAYGTKGDYERSVADFSAVILRNPKLTQAYNGRCYTLALMGDAAHALEDCNRALALEPNTPYILDSRAYAFLRAGDFPRALADYDLILQIEPKNAPALYGRGIARLRLGRRQDGEQDLVAARAADAGIDAEMQNIGVAP